jgi:(1->4)-alpha-D-glucan 1-alpha-D-glucosylmutase
VLEHGPASRFARYFDIDWDPPQSELRGRVLLPILEDHYSRVLEAGKLRLERDGGGLGIRYYERRLPISPRSYQRVFEEVAAPARILLTEHEPEFRDALQRAVETINGRPGEPRSFDRLDELLRSQCYRLAWWKVAAEEINYRRFFDVNDLVSLRMEDPEVFAATHRLAFELLREGLVHGLRIDHPDGLWNPRQYFERLQQEYEAARLTLEERGAGADGKLYVVVEKILSAGESLPDDWPVDGTTGYDFLNQVGGLFVARENAGRMDEIHREFTGCAREFEAIASASKKKVLEDSFAGEVNALARRAKQFAAKSRLGLDVTLKQIREALIELLAAFPVYRTYATEEPVSAADLSVLRRAFAAARRAGRLRDDVVFEFLEGLFGLSAGLEMTAELRENELEEIRRFRMRFQQLTGPVTAKGIEDTAFYRYHRLISLNEVGGDPGVFGRTVEEFHAMNLSRLEQWPHTLLATSTHDTKRGEDARARLHVLSEIPNEWRSAVVEWAACNSKWKRETGGQQRLAPDANDEYLLYQTLIGAWPNEEMEPRALAAFQERVCAFMLKAIREAKWNTSWIEPNFDYEEAVRRFVRDVLMNSPEFLKSFLPFQRRISYWGRLNSLSQTLLKLTCPGVPDFYQGTELWDFSLVDPDNRRPVDYERRHAMLKRLREEFGSGGAEQSSRGDVQELLENGESGEVKLFLIWRVLRFRNASPELFERGAYEPLACEGVDSSRVCAFARCWRSKRIVVVAPLRPVALTRGMERLPLGEESWGRSYLKLPANLSSWRDLFTGKTLHCEQDGSVRLADVFGSFPVAALEIV